MAITETITKIQFRRGITSERETVVLSPGEPGWDTEQKILYIGDNTPGGVPCIKFNSSEFDLTDSEGVSLIYNGLDYNTIINNIRGNSSAIATTSRLGIIKVGAGLAIDSNGKLDVSLGSGGSLLPIATQSTTGVVSVPGNGGIVVGSDGAITIDESKLDFSKVTYDSSSPPNPNTGDMWYDTAGDGALNIWSGSTWIPISTTGTGDGSSGGGGVTYLSTPHTLLDIGYTYAGNDPSGNTPATTPWGTNRGIYQTFNIPTSVVPADATGILLRATTTSNDDNGVSCNTKVYIKTSRYGERMISHSFSINNGDDSSGDVNSLIVPYTSSIDIKYDGKQNDAVISSAKVYIDGYLTSGGGGNEGGGITGKSVLLDQPEILYAKTLYTDNVPQYIQDHYNNNQNPSTNGTISAGSQVPSDAVEVLLHCSVNSQSASLRAGFFTKHSNQTEWKTIILNTEDSNHHPSTNSTWVPLDENGRLEWKYEGTTGGTTHLYLLEIQGYRTAGSGDSGSTPPPQIVDGQAVASYSSGWKKIDDPGNNNITTVANGATLTYKHDLGSTDTITQIYVSPYSDGSSARSLELYDTGANTGTLGATVTNMTTDTVRVQLASRGYVSINSSGLNYLDNTVGGHEADSGGFVSFDKKFIKVICFAPEKASAPKLPTPPSSSGGWRYTEELTIDSSYGKDDILFKDIPPDATEVQLVLSEVALPYTSAIYFASQRDTIPYNRRREDYDHLFERGWYNGVIRMSRSVGDRWFIELRVDGGSGRLQGGRRHLTLTDISTVSKHFANGFDRILIHHTHPSHRGTELILKEGFIRFSYR